MAPRSMLLTEEEARSYHVRSIASVDRRPGLYFATLKAPSLPDLTIRVEYKPRVHTEGLYSTATISEGSEKVVPIRYASEFILREKVTKVIEIFKDLNYDEIKRQEEKTNGVSSTENRHD